jgi:ATP-dependent Clp protease adaptor protein ClpS
MWILISAVFLIIIIYLLIRLVQQGGGTIEQTSSKKIFSGFETHAIIVLDDEINSMETVVNTLVRVIGISEKQSVNLMLRIHKEGIAIVWTGARNEAEQSLQHMREAGLLCFLAEIVSKNF